MDRVSDSDLVGQTLAGSARAGDLLFERHWPTVWRTALAVTGDRTLADDVAQDAIERAFTALSRFDRRRPFRPWLVRIAANQALNVLRSRRREVPTAELGELTAVDDRDEAPDRDGLMDAVRALPDERRLVVALRYFADLEPVEIAEALGLPAGTVSSRLSRALADLRRHLEVTPR